MADEQIRTADITRTTHGVAHIRAADLAGLGFGQGWACTEDHPGVIADQAVKLRSERSLHHGRGRSDAHVASDFGYLAIGITRRAEALREAFPPEQRSMISGYVAGHNARLARAVDEGTLPGWCRDAPWLGPIDDLDAYRILVDLTLLASGRNLIGLIGRAEAPGPDGPVPPSPLDALGGPAEGAGSNAWGFGKVSTASGGGLLVANPHFPWDGEARFWECHLTLEGEDGFDVYGTSIIGAPGIQIGFNRHVAWTHTVSRGHRFTLDRLDLVPGDPTRYRHGESERAMAPTTHRIRVRDEGDVERTLWNTHHGPMLNMPLLGWGTDLAFTYRDANIDNTTVFSTWLAMDAARSLDELRDAISTQGGIPWVNTIAVDATGRAWYSDASATPALSPSAEDRFRERLATDPIAALLMEKRAAMLDGSDPDDDWLDLDGARSPGLVPRADLPELEREDFVVNANDSYWLTNHREPLPAGAVLHGLHGVSPSLRTRLNLQMATELSDAGGLTVDGALEALFDDRTLLADRLVDPIVARLRSAGLETEADLLDRWDRRFDLTSRGAVLWREIMAHFAPTELNGPGRLWADAFDPERPLDTPSVLQTPPEDPDADPVVIATREAVALLERAGIAIDVALGDVQWVNRGGTRVPVHGGGEAEGVVNIMTPVGAVLPSTIQPRPEWVQPFPERAERSGLGEGGYCCTYGASIVLAVDLGGPEPTAKGLLAYGQYADPDHPDAAAQAEAFSERRFRDIAFTEGQIAADPNRTHLRVTG